MCDLKSIWLREIYFMEMTREKLEHNELLVCSVSIRSDFYEVEDYLKLKNTEYALELKKKLCNKI